ncbi:MAG TPA: SAM-dependent methyltransferase [Streptosporangiaceae bacterium]
MPSGSYLVLLHAASDIQPEVVIPGMDLSNRVSSTPLSLRPGEQVWHFFGGLDLVGPSLVPLGQW